MFETCAFLPSLGSDNHSGVHPRVIEAILAANRGGAHAYGGDEVSRLLDVEIARVFGPRARPHLVFNGTAANVLALASGLRSWEGVITSEVAHLHESECTAPEKWIGGKIWTLPSADGRLRPDRVEPLLSRRGDQHAPQPRWVSLTQPTEYGVCYSVDELREWGEFCRRKSLMLHVDGARLANAAARLGCSLASLTSEVGVDALSFGGTKNGLLGAEAVVFFTPALARDFKFLRKQAMQLPSKTRFLAAQFYAYLEGDLWREIAEGVNSHARELGRELAAFPEIEIVHEVETNALFVTLPEAWLAPLREHVFFYVWDRARRRVRWMIGWDWTAADTQRLVERLHELRRDTPGLTRPPPFP